MIPSMQSFMINSVQPSGCTDLEYHPVPEFSVLRKQKEFSELLYFKPDTSRIDCESAESSPADLCTIFYQLIAFCLQIRMYRFFTHFRDGFHDLHIKFGYPAYKVFSVSSISSLVARPEWKAVAPPHAVPSFRA